MYDVGTLYMLSKIYGLLQIIIIIIIDIYITSILLLCTVLYRALVKYITNQ